METRYDLGLDENNYLTYISSVGDGPCIESLDGYDFSGCRLQAHRWNGETLVFDEVRYAALAQEETQQAAQEQIAEYRRQLRQTDDVVLETLEGLMNAKTAAGFIAALIDASAAIQATLTERSALRERIRELEGEA